MTKQNEIFAYVFDFVHFLMDNLGSYSFRGIILFGSVARGDFGPGSDIDLFIDATKDLRALELIVKKSQREFESASSRSWRLRKIELPLRPIVGDLNSSRWSALKREIISSGITLFGEYRELPKNQKHFFLFSISLKGLKPRLKVKFIRRLYGYQTKKEKKTYRHFGMLEQEKAVKLNPSTLLVPAVAYKELYSLIKEFKIKCRVREVWM